MSSTFEDEETDTYESRRNTTKSDRAFAKRNRNLRTMYRREDPDEAKQYILRSATRWQEKEERNNKYFYEVIKQRQAQQTIQKHHLKTVAH